MMKGLFCFQMPFEGFFNGCLKKGYINSSLFIFNSSLYFFILTIWVCFALLP